MEKYGVMKEFVCEVCNQKVVTTSTGTPELIKSAEDNSHEHVWKEIEDGTAKEG